MYVALAAEVLVHNLERAWPSLPVVVIQEGPKKFFIFLWRCSTFRSYFWQADVRRGVIHRQCRKKPIELRSCSVRGARVWAQCAKRRYTQSCLEGRGRGVEFPLPPSTQTSSEVINLNPLTRHQNRRQWSCTRTPSCCCCCWRPTWSWWPRERRRRAETNPSSKCVPANVVEWQCPQGMEPLNHNLELVFPM